MNRTRLSNPPCPYCRAQSPFYFRIGDRNRHMSGEVFSYHRCPSCGLIFLPSIPDDLSSYYTDEYYNAPPTPEILSAASENDRYKIDIVKRFVANGRLLEIGPAYGSFALLAKNAGFETEAMEMNARCCRFMTEKLGIRAYNERDICATLKRTGPYDVIASWHVVEHLTEPFPALRAMAETVLRRGIVVIAAPNPDALQFRLFGRFWTHVDAPRHVALLPAALIVRHMESLGMRTVLQTTSDPGTLFWNIFGWEYSLANFFRHPKAKALARMAGRVWSRITAPIERKGTRGTAYTLVFQKP